MKKQPRKARRAPVARTPREPRLSRALAPTDLSLVEWQRILRRQFGREQAFLLENLGTERFFSEFRVSNPQSKASYRVAMRGVSPGDNRCTCPDYATNELGTCKHIEFVLARLETKHGAKAASHAAISRRFRNSPCAMRGDARSTSAPVPSAGRRTESSSIAVRW